MNKTKLSETGESKPNNIDIIVESINYDIV